MQKIETFYFSFILSILFQSSYIFKFINNPTIVEYLIIFYAGLVISTILYTLIFFSIFSFLELKKNIFFSSLNLFFNFFVFVVFLRTIFFIFGVPRISDFLSNYDIIVFTLLQKIYLILILFFIFLGLIFLNKKYLKLDIKRILKTYVIVLSTVLIFNLYNSTKFITNAYLEKENFDSNYISNKSKKVYFFIFDELDTKILNENNQINKTNLNNFKSKSIFFKNGFTPGRDTLYSIYSTLLGQDGSGTFQQNFKGFNYKNSDENIEINFQNSFFSIYHPEEIALIGSQGMVYCIYLEIPHCSDSVHDLNKNFKRLLNFFEIPKIVFNLIFRNYLFNLEAQKTDKAVIDKIYENEKEKIKQISINERVLIQTLKAIKNDSFKIIYSHFPFPHHPSHYAKKLLGKNEILKDDYLTNLNLFNLVLKQLIDEIQIHNKDEDYLIIITSDHGKRAEERILGNHRAVPLIIKLGRESNNIELAKNISTYHIGELIEKYNKNEINNHEEIKSFFENRRVYKPEMKNIDIIFKRRLNY